MWARHAAGIYTGVGVPPLSILLPPPHLPHLPRIARRRRPPPQIARRRRPPPQIARRRRPPPPVGPPGYQWPPFSMVLAQAAAALAALRGGRGAPPCSRARPRKQPPSPTPTPPQWAYWRPGNENLSKKNKNYDQQLRIYRRLENSHRVNKMELAYFTIPEGLLIQPAHIVNKLRDIVSLYNMMMPLRQRALYKYLDGYSGKETDKINKILVKTVLCVDDKIAEILAAGWYCPPRPNVFDDLPRLN
uniref:Uncharacterized protein n=1 Tax=Triticum urartu TaxID=4572 RepID=A0A8R7R2I9_TRIUA